MLLSPLVVRLERDPIAIVLRCPCGEVVRRADTFDPIAECPVCGAELDVDIQRAGVVLGRA